MLASWTAVPAQSPPSDQTLIALERARSLGGGALEKILTGSDAQLAARAALAIGRTKNPAGVPLLEAHINDRSIALRAMSVYGLGLLGTGASARQIILKIQHDGAGAVRIAALDAIGRYVAGSKLHGSDPALAAIVIGSALQKDADPIVRARAATAYEAFRDGPMGDYASHALVAAWNRERNEDVRWHIMWTIFRGYAVRVPRQVLAAALHDHSELVRIEAVRAYGRLKNKDAIADLQPLTQDESWRVQLQALESIRALSGQALTEHLKEMPAGIHTPPVHVQNFMEIAPLPRANFVGKPSAPTAADAITTPKINPVTSAFITGPMPGPHPQVRIHTTKGTIIVMLFPEWAPLTVENFLNLTNRGYYDGLRWFRIVPDFVAQTGDSGNTGEGDAGYMIGAEENPLEQRSYALSMGLNYDTGPIRDSAGTQFYITLSPQLHLNRDFTVFGQVTSGFDVLGRLVETDTMLRVEQIPDAPYLANSEENAKSAFSLRSSTRR